MALYLAFAVLISLPALISASRLQVSGSGFKFGGKKVFLSGGNLPWINYAYDFGNNQWAGVKWKVNNQMKMLKQAGGNTMRLWIHIQGESSPQFDNNGYVVGPDKQGTFMNDFKNMLDMAKSNKIMVIPTLWNNAVNQDKYGRLKGLLTDWKKLESYIEKVLKPLVEKVKGHPALAAWDILNEPEGSINPGQYDKDPCFDTRKLSGSGAGWAGKKYSYRQVLMFINWHANAIKSVDPGALVTNGVWNPRASTDAFGMFNHYKDECLIKAGKRPLGKLDFYQFHDYSHGGKFDQYSTFNKHKYSQYKTSKPIVVGEFWAVDGGGMSDSQLFQYVYQHGFAGAWSWDLVGHGNKQRPGISHIKNYHGNGQTYVNV